MDYIRDGRAPVPKSEATSKVMRGNKGKDTRPELALREALIKIGISDFVIHMKNIPGRPDIAYPKKKLAIFVHGCFWHHCPKCKPNLPKSNTEYWKIKFKRNKERDTRKIKALKDAGWKTLVVWEHEIKEDVVKCANKINSKLY